MVVFGVRLIAVRTGFDRQSIFLTRGRVFWFIVCGEKGLVAAVLALSKTCRVPVVCFLI